MTTGSLTNKINITLKLRVRIMWPATSAFCVYKHTNKQWITNSRVEARSNTSTVTLRVVRGDEKGSLKTETAKYVREIQGTRTRERLRCWGPAAYTKDRPVFSSERAPHKNKTVTVKQ
jgi:hypothetical protein